MIIAALPILVVSAAHQWKPDLHRARRKHLPRHYPDDRIRLVAKRKCASEGVRIALKNSFPKFVADDGELWSTDAIFFLGKDPPDLRRQADDFEKVCCNDRARHLLRLASRDSAQ